MSTETTRRSFLIRLAQGLAGATVAGGVWSSLIREGKATPLTLRPPGALSELKFQAACIKCGLCVTACPYDTLKLADLASGVPVGTPFYEPRQIPCELCEDIPCARACPTGALDRGMKDIIKEARMGLAVLNPDTCIAMKGLRCEACYRACPVIDEALSLRFIHQERTGAHAFFEPVVDADYCTGCGQCERACVMDESAIRVRPREVALGKIGEHFQIGWEEESEITSDFEQGPPPQLKPAKETEAAPGMDYLNGGDDL